MIKLTYLPQATPGPGFGPEGDERSLKNCKEE